MKIQVKIEDQMFDVEIDDLNARPVIARVDGETIEVFPQEDIRSIPAHSATASELSSAAVAAPVAAAAQAPVAVSGAKVVTAPIPGTIVGISVKPGDAVETGQELCALEAMKMKNLIRATRSGKIAVVHVSVGAKVKHGQPLVEFSE